MENNSFSDSNNKAVITTTTTAAAVTNFTTFTDQQLNQPNMVNTQNSHQCLPPFYHQNMQFPYTFPLLEQQPAAYPVYPVWFGQNEIQNGAQEGSWVLESNIGLPKEPQRTVLDAQKTKIARIKRKLARQKSLSLQRNASSSSSLSRASSSGHFDVRRIATSAVDSRRDLFNFCTLDNKRLRVLLKKELKNSDVGSLGRIVLPKREAEENLPGLSDKEGIHVVFRDVNSDKFWTLKFKYWSNNKSRMYVLENTVDFVKQNGMEIGDSLTLYEDKSKNLYFSIKKVEKPADEQSKNQHQYRNCIQNQVNHQLRDEEEASLALLIEQLKQEPYFNFMTLPMEEANNVGSESNNNTTNNPGSHDHLAASSLSHGDVKKMKNVDDDHHHCRSVDDCFGCFDDMLPDMDFSIQE